MRHDDSLAYWERACEQQAAGNLLGALATLDDGLAAAGLREGTDLELALLLSKKADIVGGPLHRHYEALALYHRVLQVAEGKRDDDRLLLVAAFSSVGIARLLGKLGRHSEAETALRKVAASYGSDEDQYLRAVAASALACWVSQLLTLGDFDRARKGWESLRGLYCDDPDSEVRAEVARGGAAAALGLLALRQTTAALETAEEVIALYRRETDTHIRVSVATALWVRVAALRRKGRLLRAWRGRHDVARFLGSDPDPEVIEAIRIVARNLESVLRLARGDRHERD